MDEIQLVLMIPPRTKKNSQQILTNKKTGRSFVMPSGAYKAYEKAALSLIPKGVRVGIDYPVNVRCVFYMETRRKVDLANLLEAADDVLVKAGVLADDNSGIVAGHDGSRVLYDRERPRTEIEITRMEGI